MMNTAKTEFYLISKILLSLILTLVVSVIIFFAISYKPDSMERQLKGASDLEGIVVGILVNNPVGSPPKPGSPKTVFIVRLPSNNVVQVPVPNETPYKENGKVQLVKIESKHGLYRFAFGSYIDRFSGN
jgi:hypothetical protein